MSRAELDPVLTSISAPIDDTLQEKCGVVGVYSPEGFAVPISYYAIEALQHRGQDGSGFAFVEKTPGGSSRFDAIRRVGRIATAFNNGEDLFEIVGPEQAIAHTRYATTEARDETEALHPLPFEANGKKYALAHNGQFDMYNLQLTAFECGIDPVGTDTEILTKLLKLHIEEYGHIEVAFHKLLPQLEGAFSLVIQGEEGIYGVRDRHGLRPLVMGKDGDSIMLASETRALLGRNSKGEDHLNFDFTEEVNPGTYVVVNDQGVREVRWEKENKKACIFELVYLSKIENQINGRKVVDYREEAGRILASQEDVFVYPDIVVPVLGSAKAYAEGYCEVSGVPSVHALKKNPNRNNPDSDRTFIEKTQQLREAAVRDKFIVDIEAVRGKSVMLMDDSLVRGTTTKIIIEMLRQVGAKEIHVRIGSDRYSKPCAFGVNVQTEEELLAYKRTIDEMCKEIGADSLSFLGREMMHKAANVKSEEVCDGCMGGEYPQPRPQKQKKLALV